MLDPAVHVPPSRLAPLVGLCLIVLVGVVSVAAQQRDWTRMPPAAESHAAAAWVAAESGADDAVRTWPLWYDDARVGLGDAHILTGRLLDPWDFHRFETLWGIVPARYGDAAREQLAAHGMTAEVAERFGGVEVLRASFPRREAVAWDAFLSFDEAVVERVHRETGAVTPCEVRARGERHCGRVDPWIYAFAATREVDDTYRDCIQVNLAPPPEIWRLRWPEVPRTAALRFRAGNTLLATRSERAHPSYARLLIDGQVVHERTTGGIELGYPEVIVTPPPGPATMEVSVELATDNHFDRFYCFRAQALGSPAPALETAP